MVQTVSVTTAPAPSGLAGYRAVWALPTVPATLLLGVLCRIPAFALTILFLLHLVENVTPSYSRAGIITATLTVAMSASAPWRGHLLDKQGLRATMPPSIIVLVPTYLVMGLVDNYWVLLVCAMVAGGLAFPTFSVIRQVLIGASPVALRKTTIALDSTITELCFMIGPALAIWLATAWSTRGALLVFAMLSVVGAVALTIANPSIIDQHLSDEDAPAGHRFSWVNVRVLGILLAVMGCGFVLSGTDLGVVAGLRDLGRPGLIGVVLAAWGLGSAAAGLAYGALHRPIPVTWLLVGLGATTIPVMFANSVWTFAAILMVAGIFCAPTLVAAVDQLQQAVPPRFRGQAMGGQGTAITIGNASAPPLVGWTIDHQGWRTGFLVTGAAGLVAGLFLLVAIAVRRHQLRRRRGAVTLGPDLPPDAASS